MWASSLQVQEGQITHIQYEQGAPFLQESQVEPLGTQGSRGPGRGPVRLCLTGFCPPVVESPFGLLTLQHFPAVLRCGLSPAAPQKAWRQKAEASSVP